jgi:hypothetical protein
MAGAGIFNSSSLVQDLAAKSFSSLITRLAPNGNSPLFGLTSMLKTETAVQVEHGYFSKTMLFPQMTSYGTDIAAVTTTLDVVSTTNILPGMVMQCDSTHENMIVNTVVSSTQVTVTRGVGITAAIIPANSKLWMVGNAYEEASARPVALQITAVRVTNYTQIFRNTWTISDTLRATMVIAGDTNVAESRQDCAAFHAADIEKALFFGQKYQGTRNGQPFRTMDGIINMTTQNAAANITTLGSTTTYTQLEAAIDPVFNQTTDPKTANQRLLFVGGGAKRVLNNIGRVNGTYYLVDGQTNYGLQFSTFKLARGTLTVIEHPLFNAYGVNSYMYKMGVVVDMPTFNLAYLNDRKTMNREFNLDNTPVDNGIDAVGGTLTTEATCLIKNFPANAVLYNFTAAAVG